MGKEYKASLTNLTKKSMTQKSGVLGLTRVSEKYQTRLPMDAVRALKVEVGDKILWRLEGGKIVVEKA